MALARDFQYHLIAAQTIAEPDCGLNLRSLAEGKVDVCGHQKKTCCGRRDLRRRNLSGMATVKDEILIKLGILMLKFLPVYLPGSPYIELVG